MASDEFRNGGKVDEFIDMSTKVIKKGENKSTFLLKIFVGTSDSLHYLPMPSRTNSFSASSGIVVLKEK